GRYKILRGGSWYDDHNLVRCAYQICTDPHDRSADYGFRVARGSPG
ncbi:MAG: SUMF1/EgtB/PvdO family nonheme iron enzyme, partial [Delftia sp.]|nr:SUMF1/EgtB/PvdO family nonheme iron enzyme [Delftia sp.]